MAKAEKISNPYKSAVDRRNTYMTCLRQYAPRVVPDYVPIDTYARSIKYTLKITNCIIYD